MIKPKTMADVYDALRKEHAAISEEIESLKKIAPPKTSVVKLCGRLDHLWDPFCADCRVCGMKLEQYRAENPACDNHAWADNNAWVLHVPAMKMQCSICGEMKSHAEFAAEETARGRKEIAEAAEAARRKATIQREDNAEPGNVEDLARRMDAEPLARLMDCRQMLARDDLAARGVDTSHWSDGDLCAHYDRVVAPREAAERAAGERRGCEVPGGLGHDFTNELNEPVDHCFWCGVRHPERP
jgi:hypothetical protein